MLQLRFLFWISEIVVVLLVMIPIARFLLYQWSFHQLEFVNRFSHGEQMRLCRLGTDSLRTHRRRKPDSNPRSRYEKSAPAQSAVRARPT